MAGLSSAVTWFLKNATRDFLSPGVSSRQLEYRCGPDRRTSVFAGIFRNWQTCCALRAGLISAISVSRSQLACRFFPDWVT